jgi:hypothetical protein
MIEEIDQDVVTRVKEYSTLGPLKQNRKIGDRNNS